MATVSRMNLAWVTIPISSFVSRTDWQPAGAVVNGSIQSPVVSFHFYSYPTATGNRTATFTFDQIGHTHQLMHENKHPAGNMACLVGAPKTGMKELPL